MRNHDQKTKDMVESVLPSTRREAAREERREIHRRHRSRQQVQLRRVHLSCGEHEFDTGMERARSVDIRLMVDERRTRDKTGSLERWARVRVQRDPQLRERPVAEQVEAFARLLPRTLMGRHAADHIRWALQADDRRAEFAD